MRPILAALMLVAAIPARADVSTDTAKLLSEYRSAWLRADAAALGRLFTPDANLQSLGGEAYGTAAITALYSASLAQIGRSSVTTRLDRTQMITRDVAYGRGTFALTPDGTPEPMACGSFVAVLRREAAGWRIAAFSEAALACPGVSP